MLAIHSLTRFLPIATDTTGKRPPRVYPFLQKLVPLSSASHLPDGIVADTTQPSERILAYFFYNILRYYRKSPLYHYLRTRLHPGDIFIDIGAHLGIYSYFARKLGAETILFEPDPAHGAFLVRNKHLFDRVFCLAVADKSQMATFFRGRHDNTGAGSLVASMNSWETSGYAAVTQVQSARIDKLFDPGIWPRVALIKIDVEGAEALVLRGMGEVLRDYAFDIWCEVRDDTSDRNPGSYHDVCSIAAEAGYRAHVFNSRRIAPFRPAHIRRVFDLLFLKKNVVK
jgi:FkbM family methyltransferase